MHLQTLTGEKIRIIKAQAALAAESCWYLAGGSALALHLGHRTSRDLDWFSEKTFDQQALRQALQKTHASNISASGGQTVRAFYGLIETSFIAKPGIGSSVESVNIGGHRIQIASIDQIAQMKMLALCNRGYKRDFIDIYAIIKAGHHTIPSLVRLAERIGLPRPQIERSLGYFGDAEKQDDPEECRYSWKEVRSFFESR